MSTLDARRAAHRAALAELQRQNRYIARFRETAADWDHVDRETYRDLLANLQAAQAAAGKTFLNLSEAS